MLRKVQRLSQLAHICSYINVIGTNEGNCDKVFGHQGWALPRY